MKSIALSFVLSIFFFANAAAQPGSLDTSFGGGDGIIIYPNLIGSAKDVAVQSDGKILALAGPGNYVMSLIRLNVDGSVDTSFNQTGIRTLNWNLTYRNNIHLGLAWAVGIQNILGSERIVVAGRVSQLVGKAVRDFVRVERFMADGTTDTSFGNNGTVTLFEGEVYDILIQSNDQKIVGVTQGSNKLFRLNASGSLDATFGYGGVVTGSGTLQRLTQDTNDGSILVASTVPSGSGKNANINIQVRRYDASGSPVSTFGTSGAATFGRSNYSFVPKSIAVDPQRNILIGTRAWVPGQDFAAVRFTQNGLVDTYFAANGLYLAGYSATDARASATLLQGDGKIVMIGDFYNSGGGPKDAVVIRLNNDGSVDSGFGISGSSIFDIAGNDYVSIGPGGVIQIDPFCTCEKIVVVSASGGSLTFARLNTL